MDIRTFLMTWLEVSNSYDTEKYLDMFQTDAVLDDPSVGRKFLGHEGIRNYFTSYFVGYKTQTKMTAMSIAGDTAYMEVEFKGTFPEGKIAGLFNFSFEDGKIAKLDADLL